MQYGYRILRIHILLNKIRRMSYQNPSQSEMNFTQFITKQFPFNSFLFQKIVQTLVISIKYRTLESSIMNLLFGTPFLTETEYPELYNAQISFKSQNGQICHRILFVTSYEKIIIIMDFVFNSLGILPNHKQGY